MASRNEIVQIRYKLLGMTQNKDNTSLKQGLIIKLIQRLTELLIRMQNKRQEVTLKWLPVLQSIKLVEGAKGG